jgi:hypothetical protein
MIGRLVVAGIALAMWLSSAAVAAGPGWSVQATPNPSGATNSVLSGVSCPSTRVCTAVGYFTDPAGNGVTLAERWNGTRWSIEPTPSLAGSTASLLFAVSCPSTRTCIAVGSVTERSGITVPLAERWNGLRWSIQSTPNPTRAHGRDAAYLGSVSCASRTACIAVGFSGNEAGTAGVTLAEGWNGTSWSIERSLQPAGAAAAFLSGVSCPVPAACTAVGYSTTLSGGAVTLAESWNGTRWSIQRSATPAGSEAVQLTGVSCAVPSSCTAVGFFTAAGINVMLAEGWNGTSWSIQRSPYPAGAAASFLSGVSCPSPASCTAVGYSTTRNGYGLTLAERWSGTSWAIQPSPTPQAAAAVQLTGVSCASPSSCTAVGYFTVTGINVMLAEGVSSSSTSRGCCPGSTTDTAS